MQRKGMETMSGETIHLPIENERYIIDGNTVVITIEPLGVGNGKAHSEIDTHEGAKELCQTLVANLAPIDPEASTGCGDGRELVGLISKNEEDNLTVSPKLFGGGPHAALGMELLTGTLKPTEDYEKLFVMETEKLAENGRRPGAHVDNLHTENDSHCGSLDGAKTVYGVISDPDNADALKPLVEYYTEVLGYKFDEMSYQKSIDNASNVFNSETFNNWNGMKAVETVKEKEGLVRVLDGGSEDDPAHNHRESLIAVILKENIGLDKESFINQSGKQVFVVTFPQLVKKAKIIASSPSLEKLQNQERDLVQAGVLFQLAHALIVPDGSQYLVNIM